jgi:ectoine hydroxylase-related dioxygenase (phytanoyl-CoA dioxygenase family)
MESEFDAGTHAERVRRDGYTIVPGVLTADEADVIIAELDRLERDLGIVPSPNLFEGAKTVRIYNLLVHGPLFEAIPLHERVLPIVERVLDPGCLISSLSSIAIGPGEVPQPIHADDQLIPIPKPHPPVVCNSMWALTDFTDANGATRIIPGSHLRDRSPGFGKDYETIAAEMPKGSVMVYDGAMWHGGGANRTDARRVGVAMNYCAGYIRQQENQQLGVPRELVRRFPPRLRELVGYGVYNGLIGHIDKKTPAMLLDEETKGKAVVWDDLPV